jgi:phage-related protein
MNKVVFYEDHRGVSPVEEYIDSLKQPAEKAKVLYVLLLLEEFGVKLNMPHAKPIKDKLWELRPGKNRLLYFAHVENQFVILHAFKKKTNKTPKKEIDTAQRRMQEVLEE